MNSIKADQITEEEYTELVRIILSDRSGEVSNLVVGFFENNLTDLPRHPKRDQLYFKNAFSEILKAVEVSGKDLNHENPKDHDTEPQKTVPVVSIFRRSWFRYAVAVAFVVGIGAFLLQVIKKNSPSPAIERAVMQNDVAPGTNKAILTLGNGSKIILDSAQNGFLTHQSGSSVIKTDIGQLAYTTSNEKPITVNYNTLTTPRGGQYQLMLPDGTRVWLNAASSVTYPTAFIGKEREVSMTGEAYFEVVHKARQPFRVKVNEQIIEDIGTSFNVNGYQDELITKTTLIEGSIKVKWQQKTELLKPGEQVSTSQTWFKVTDNTDVDDVISWKNGEIELTHGDVKKFFREISRWYNVDVIYQGNVPNRVFSASLKRNLPLSNLLNVLKTNGVETRLEGNKIIVE